MTNRERAMNILHYQPVDRFPAVHFGYWSELLEEWAEQGKIPKDLAVDNYDGSEKDRELDKLIGWDFNWSRTTGSRNGLFPSFEYKVLETLPDGTQRVQNSVGLIERVKPGVASIPSEDDYILKDREAFETLYKPKMLYAPERVDVEYYKHFNETRPTDVPVGLHVGSLLGDIRNMVSVVGMSYLIYDEDEELFADIVDTYAEMQYQCVKTVLETGAKFDFAHYWEDICFKNGPLMIPAVFDELMGPWYKKVTDLARPWHRHHLSGLRRPHRPPPPHLAAQRRQHHVSHRGGHVERQHRPLARAVRPPAARRGRHEQDGVPPRPRRRRAGGRAPAPPHRSGRLHPLPRPSHRPRRQV